MPPLDRDPRRCPVGYRIVRTGGSFDLFYRRRRIGQAYVDSHRPGEYVLGAIDIAPKHQRQGHGRVLFTEIVERLRRAGATVLRASAEGSGTVQLFRGAFGDDVVYACGEALVDYAEAVRIMDVAFGRLCVEAHFTGQANDSRLTVSGSRES